MISDKKIYAMNITIPVPAKICKIFYVATIISWLLFYKHELGLGTPIGVTKFNWRDAR
jgi:hypothetical protein